MDASRPLKVSPAWGEKKLRSHKTGLGGPSDKGHLSALLPVLMGQREGWASGLLPAAREGSGDPSFGCDLCTRPGLVRGLPSPRGRCSRQEVSGRPLPPGSGTASRPLAEVTEGLRPPRISWSQTFRLSPHKPDPRLRSGPKGTGPPGHRLPCVTRSLTPLRAGGRGPLWPAAFALRRRGGPCSPPLASPAARPPLARAISQLRLASSAPAGDTHCLLLSYVLWPLPPEPVAPERL